MLIHRVFALVPRSIFLEVSVAAIVFLCAIIVVESVADILFPTPSSELLLLRGGFPSRLRLSLLKDLFPKAWFGRGIVFGCLIPEGVLL
jgi:hypothetical protein